MQCCVKKSSIRKTAFSRIDVVIIREIKIESLAQGCGCTLKMLWKPAVIRIEKRNSFCIGGYRIESAVTGSAGSGIGLVKDCDAFMQMRRQGQDFRPCGLW